MFWNSKPKNYLSFEECKSIIDTFSYKPDITVTDFRIKGDLYEIVFCRLLKVKEDITEVDPSGTLSLSEGDELTIEGSYSLAKNYFTSKQQVMNFVRIALLSFEIHEVDEFIKFDKIQVFNPHTKDYKLVNMVIGSSNQMYDINLRK